MMQTYQTLSFATLPAAKLEELTELIEAQPGWRRIGAILVEGSYLDRRAIDQALAEQARRGPAAPTGLLDLLVETPADQKTRSQPSQTARRAPRFESARLVAVTAILTLFFALVILPAVVESFARAFAS